MRTLNNIKSLGVTLEELYDNNSQIIIKLSDKPYEFTVVLKDRNDKPDCKISSFGANLWVRTEKGINYEKYKSLSTLQSSLTRLIKSRVDTEGDISFHLTKDVCLI